MFRGLKGRRIIANLETGEALRGRVISAGLFTVRLADFEVLDGHGAGPQPAAGVARFPWRRVTWIQELTDAV